MKINEYSDYLDRWKLNDREIKSAIGNVMDLEQYLIHCGHDIDSVPLSELRGYYSRIAAEGRNTIKLFTDLKRYFYMTGQNDAYIYTISVTSGREVIDSISRKLERKAGSDCRDRIFSEIETPPLGSPPECYPPNTCSLVNRLLELGEDICHDVLADNHHGIPRDAFKKQMQWFEESDSIDSFLKRLHSERIMILEQYLNEGKVWFEQEITPEVVELVRGNQEILSAVREGEYLFITKIPYSPKNWLQEIDDTRKRYYACHCPLAREAIMNNVDIPPDWCYCSGGFGKLMFDIIFDESTEVEVLQSVLGGDPICRFKIRIPQKML